MLIYSNLSYDLKENIEFCNEACYIIYWPIPNEFLEYLHRENCMEHFARGNTTRLFPSLLKALHTIILNFQEFQQFHNLWECYLVKSCK